VRAGRWRRFGFPGAIVLAVAGCAPFAAALPLPTDRTWSGAGCLGVGRDAVLHGSASDPRVTWAEDRNVAARIELLWPIGYRARFVPQLELLDERGTVVGHEGDLIIGSCTTDPPGGDAVRVSAIDVRPPTWQLGDG
jgi:hypothetical protein